MWDAVRDRVEVEGHGPTWRITGGSFETSLDYARARFDDPVVLRREDRGRWWPRVTLTVSTDPSLADSAPPLQDLERPVVPPQRRRHDLRGTDEPANGPATDPGAGADPPRAVPGPLPDSLEAIFAHQEELRVARQRTPALDRARHADPPGP